MHERTTTRYDRAEPQCYQGFGFMMRRLLVTLMVLFVAVHISSDLDEKGVQVLKLTSRSARLKISSGTLEMSH